MTDPGVAVLPRNGEEKAAMRPLTLVLPIIVLLGLLAAVPQSIAGPAELYTLEFLPTANFPEARGTMALKVVKGETVVHFRVRGARPHTIYTIWIVFNVLRDGPVNGVIPADAEGKVASGAPAGFPPEGNAVAPLARLDDAFTSGMGLDPGAVFFTNDRGDGEVQVKLDYDLVREAPVANKDVIRQCVPGPPGVDAAGKPTCPAPSESIRVTTTWLRTYIGQVNDPATECANYIEGFPGVFFWQCIDPATVDPKTGNGLPRVPRFVFNHFRLAAHPDALTHGFIGGDPVDHIIDMVGRYADLALKQ
ncbi:MAG: hypothetical protein HY726_02895 [Candidatus Rokubacteria bacterium]|nr:hypothetical protein [Candidatus Rokubacteria bacterium]